jgi:hypothetical protein
MPYERPPFLLREQLILRLPDHFFGIWKGFLGEQDFRASIEKRVRAFEAGLTDLSMLS